MKRLVLTVGLVFLTALAFQSPVKAEDGLPWPWGSECPFPWSTIEGEWAVHSSLVSDHFVFKVKKSLKNKTKLLEILRYDSHGELIAEGEGLAPAGQRIVRAAMIGESYEAGKSYWAFVRTYDVRSQANGKSACSRSRLVTVITLREINDDYKAREVHYVIDKLDSETRSIRP